MFHNLSRCCVKQFLKELSVIIQIKTMQTTTHSFEFAAVEILNKKKESIYRKTKALKWVSKNKV